MSALAVVGMACRFADAGSPAELWENVLAQRRAFRRLPPERLRVEDYLDDDRNAPDRTYAAQAAVLDGWELDRVRFRISGKSFRAADAAHWLALDVAAGALADAGYPDGAGLDRERTLVVVGNTLTGEFSRARGLRLRWPYVRRVVAARLAGTELAEEERARFLEALEHDFKSPFGDVDDETLAGALSNTIAGRICNAFDFKGGGYTVDGACASSLLAVATAAAALERGDADVAVAGGVDLSLDPFELVGFAKAGALAPDTMRVYDERSEGFWPGEGCGFVVLRRLEDAMADGAAPDVAVRGWGVSSDGAGGITRPELAGQVLALERAYARAGLDIGTVGLFEGHGTGTAIGDATELAALSRSRAAHGAAGQAPIGSVKANIGHTKAAAGVAGLIKAAVALREEVVPPTTACEEPHPELRRDGATLRIAREAERWPERAPLRAGVSAMGFGGVNAHVVLERVSAARRRGRLDARTRRLSRSAQDAELFAFAGTRASVAAAIEKLRSDAEGLALSELGDLAFDLHARLGSGDVRAALIASSPAELERALACAAAALDRRDALFVDENAGVAVGLGRAARVGYLFSGQAVTVGADGGALARRFGVVRDAIEAARLETAPDLVETAYAQPAIVASSLAGLAFLRRLGVEAELAIGHSLGELTALHWGGAFDAETLLRLARERGRAMSELADRGGGMLGLTTGEDGAARLCGGTSAVVAGLNAPLQTVVAGDEDALRVVVARAEREGIAVTRLRVSHAFHSQLVAPAAPPLREVLAASPIAPLGACVVSTITGKPLARDADLRELLVRQLTAPVRFLSAIRAAGAVDLFVEVGPGRILQRLASESVPKPAVALEIGARSLRPALFAAAALFAARAADLSPLFAGRFVRPLRPHRFLASPCESVPADDAPASARPSVRSAEPAAPEPAVADSLAAVRALVAERAELPVESVGADARLLADLHLSSIVVAEIVASAARRLGVAAPAAPGELATATVAGIAETLDRLAVTAPVAEPARVDGIASWVRPFERVLVDREQDPAPAPAVSWKLVGDRGDPFVAAAAEAFAGGGGEEGVLLVLPGRDDDVPGRLVEAARAVAERGATRFALVERGRVAASFARTLHLETHVHCCAVGVDDASALPAARREAESVRGFAEVRLGRGRRVPVLRPLQVPAGEWPLGAGEVALVTGGGKGITAECALALARRHGLALAVVGRSDPATDAELAANLRRFAESGAPFLYARADVADREAVQAAVRRTERELGPVSAILHGAGVNAPALLGELDAAAFHDALRPKVDGLLNAVEAAGPQLRLLVSFGSIIGALGLAGEAHYALANEWLRESVEALAERLPECRCLDVAWSVWAGAGMGERLGTIDALARAGVDAVPLADGIDLLERLICAPNLPRSVLAAGRFGPPATVELDRPSAPLRRFVEKRLVEYPGVELVAEAELDTGTDPYLAEHRLDGVQLLPAVLGIEAMAQAAEALLGAPPGSLEALELERPVTVPPDGKRTIRVAALCTGDGVVEAVIRSDESAFQADHFRARLRRAAPEGASPPPGIAGRIDLAPDTVYDALLFHGPRFRRLRGYRSLHARSCVAEVEARETDWFGAFLPASLVAGDPGVRDAFIHVLQACIPGTRVLPAGAERVLLARRPAGRLVVTASERSDDGSTLVWDVDAHDEDGTLVERWQGLQLRRIGEAAVPGPWPAALLVPYLERRVAELSGRHVGVSVAGDGTTDEAIAAAATRPVRIERAANGRPESDAGGVSAAHVRSLTLAVVGDGELACDVEEARPRGEAMWRDLLGGERFALARTLAGELGEDLEVSAARVWAAAECSRKTGRPQGEPLTLAGAPSDGWALVRAGRAPVATFADRVAGFESELAFAFLVEEEA